MHRFFTGLGKFTVKYRWIILVVWLVGTFAAVKALPSLSSQVNNDNSAFLPASAPDVKAANLAAPLVGKESLAPIIVIADRTSGQLTEADVTAIQREINLMKGVTNVKQVLFLGTSPNGQAVQIEALADIGGFGIQPAPEHGQRRRGHVLESRRAIRTCNSTWRDRSPTTSRRTPPRRTRATRSKTCRSCSSSSCSS